MTFRRLTPYLLISLALAWFLFNISEKKKSLKQELVNVKQSADYSIEQFSVRQFDNQGQLIHSISASKASMENQEMQLTAPRVKTRSQKTVWDISANQATSTNNHQKIVLTGNVHVTTQNDNSVSPLHLSTNSLNYSSNKKQISSESEVLLQDGGMRLNGTGFIVDLLNENYRLLSNVKGENRYE